MGGCRFLSDDHGAAAPSGEWPAINLASDPASRQIGPPRTPPRPPRTGYQSRGHPEGAQFLVIMHAGAQGAERRAGGLSRPATRGEGSEWARALIGESESTSFKLSCAGVGPNVAAVVLRNPDTSKRTLTWASAT